MRRYPPERIVCLTEGTVETLYLLVQEDRIVGVSGYAVPPSGTACHRSEPGRGVLVTGALGTGWSHWLSGTTKAFYRTQRPLFEPPHAEVLIAAFGSASAFRADIWTGRAEGPQGVRS